MCVLQVGCDVMLSGADLLQALRDTAGTFRILGFLTR